MIARTENPPDKPFYQLSLLCTYLSNMPWWRRWLIGIYLWFADYEYYQVFAIRKMLMKKLNKLLANEDKNEQKPNS